MRTYPTVSQQRQQQRGTDSFAFNQETNSPDLAAKPNADHRWHTLNSKLHRAVRARGHFPNDEAATKLLYLILNRSEKEWKMPPREWNMAKAQFAVLFGERFIKAMAA